VPTSLDAYADIKCGEGVLACDEDWLVDFETENLGLDEINR
jgi:hypothetical protein